MPTAEWVAQTQAWYRRRLLAALGDDQQAAFAAFEQRLGEGFDVDGQARLILQQRSLTWLATHVPRTMALRRMGAKLAALDYALTWRLPPRADLEALRSLERFRLDPRLEERLRLPLSSGPAVAGFAARISPGRAYLDECTNRFNRVPRPPAIGDLSPKTGWRSLGFIPRDAQFIVSTDAELRVFEDDNGICMALPRYTNAKRDMVDFDGVICLSRVTSRVCFWDNQWDHDDNPRTEAVRFSFPADAQIPIGVPNRRINAEGLYQAGGVEIEPGAGGICSDCHAGENPFIIHPLADLGGGLPMGEIGSRLGLRTFGRFGYGPIVGASWPQNQLSHAERLVPEACVGCHTRPSAGGIAGRFPHLSSDLDTDLNDGGGYCRTILAQAIRRTMPPDNPGGEARNPAVIAFQNWCGVPARGGPSSRGAGHLTTTNGLNYDFQAAGEFTALRNSDTGFELQLRQTPVLTTVTPTLFANPYTGLASCVSLNTAAALRVGTHRVTYQPRPSEAAGQERMQLRIDGQGISLPALPATGRSLGGGDRIVRAASGGGFVIRLRDGSRVVISPNYWATHGYWYLNVEVLDTPAREGTMGHIMAPAWLPARPSGASFGPVPAGLPIRHTILNRVFANAWRVTDATSLFDYMQGTSTATFTNRGWPPPPGAPASACATLPGLSPPENRPRRPQPPFPPIVAINFCRLIADPAARRNCVLDLSTTGDTALVEAYQRTLALRNTP